MSSYNEFNERKYFKSAYDDIGAKFIPDEDEIAAACAEIRKGWDKREERSRIVQPSPSTFSSIMLGRGTDLHAQSVHPFMVNPFI